MSNVQYQKLSDFLRNRRGINDKEIEDLAMTLVRLKMILVWTDALYPGGYGLRN